MSIEQDLLKAADELEKTAMEMETNVEASGEDYKKESKAEESKEKEEPGESKSEEASEDESAAGEKKEKGQEMEKEAKVTAEKVASIREELNISQEMAEKVASADPSVLELLRERSQEPVESMGDEDTREKTAAEIEECPLGSWLMEE